MRKSNSNALVYIVLTVIAVTGALSGIGASLMTWHAPVERTKEVAAIAAVLMSTYQDCVVAFIALLGGITLRLRGD